MVSVLLGPSNGSEGSMNATPQNGPMQRKSHLSAALTTSLRSQAAFVRALLDEYVAATGREAPGMRQATA